MLIGASGALNPEKDPKVNAVAVKMYEQFRNRKFDYVNVARNTGFSVEQMVIVKNYVFMDCHEFNNGYTLFTASYEMAQSWQRLSEKLQIEFLHMIFSCCNMNYTKYSYCWLTTVCHNKKHIL